VGFLSSFDHRHSLVGHPVPARDLGFPYGGLTGPLASGPDPDGVSAYRTCEARLGLGALYIPGIAVSTRSSQFLDRRRPRSNGLIPVSPVLRPDPRSGSHETSARVHGYSPHASLLRACDLSRATENCPETVMRSARWWPWDLPSGGHQRCAVR
jgi:hypothetical protein